LLSVKFLMLNGRPVSTVNSKLSKVKNLNLNKRQLKINFSTIIPKQIKITKSEHARNNSFDKKL
jgi:hypothetical protein